MMLKIRWKTVSLLLLLMSLQSHLLAKNISADINVGDADRVLRSGKIITLDNQSTEHQALAVRDGKILLTGTDEEVNKLIGPETQVIELDGRTVIPGLIDGHIHGIRAGLTFNDEVGWYDITSIEEGLEKLREKARNTAPGEWIIVAGGWVKEQVAEGRAPTLAELDEISSQHPIYIQHLYDLVMLNSAGLQAFGINDQTANPAMGKYHRDSENKLTGRITGSLPFIFSTYRKLPRLSFDQQVEGTKAFGVELSRLGLTGFIDAGGGGLFPQSFHPLYKLWRDGQLKQRIRFFVSPQRPGKELEDIMQWADFQAMGHGDDMLRFSGFGEIVVWGMHDGADIGVHFGPSEKAKNDLLAVAKYLAERQYSMQIHAHHDHSASQILDIIEQVHLDSPITDLRWSICHGEDFTEKTLLRMKALNMAWGVQNRLYFMGDDYLAIMGKKIARSAPPLNTGLKNGLVIAAGTDAHRVSPYNPFVSLEWLVNGKSLSGTVIRGVKESVSREQALRMYTQGSAWLTFEENKLGSLEIGKFADLVVLSDDYMTVDEDNISEIVSLMTMVNGEVVYAAAPFGL